MPEQTTSSGPPQWMQQIWQNAIPGFMSVANRPYQPYQGPQVAGMSSITENALGGYNSAMYGNPATWGGMGLLGNIIGGDPNKYLPQMAEIVKNDASKAFDSQIGQLNNQFSNPNSFGGARHGLGAGEITESATRGLGSALGALQYGAFDNERNRQMQAATMAQQMNNSQLSNLAQGAVLGNIPREIQQQIYNQGRTNFNEWRDYPQQQASWLANILGMSNQGAGQVSTTQTPNPNTWSQALGGLGLLGSGLGWFK
jgi:hypothetical protein